jgi:hypothetical protein
MRYYIGRGERPSVDLPQENFTDEFIADFIEKVPQTRTKLLNLLWKLKLEGKRIVGISAPAKGNTLLNYCGIGPEILDYVTEKSLLKIGRYTPGTHIFVVPDEVLIKEQSDYGLVLAWNWKDQICSKLREKGYKGKFIIPIPEPVIEEG